MLVRVTEPNKTQEMEAVEVGKREPDQWKTVINSL
jgi:hypothetical protein